MFVHNFKYTLKSLFRKKSLILWTFAFPIVLVTLFNLAFSDISDNEQFKVIDIAIVDNDDFKNNEVFKNAFKELSDKKNKDRVFKTKYESIDECKKDLEKEKVVGYLILNKDKPNIVVNTNGLNETIFKYVVDEISETNSMLKNMTIEQIRNEIKNGNTNINYDEIYSHVIEMVNNSKVKINNTFTNKLDYTMIEYYTVIAMAALYGGMIAMIAINQNLANMSFKGKRVAISSVKKSTIILSSLLASFITQVIGLIILFIYMLLVVKVDFGSNIWAIILLSLIGTLTGLSLGLFVGTIFKKSENSKTGILLAVTMLGCFFSGMMGITMKYVIDKNIPIINMINPASMITDGFYSLYYYDKLNRFFIDIGSLLVFSLILISISFISLRRQKYDSI